MKINISKIFLTLAISLGVIACTDNYEHINSDPNGLTQKELDRDGYSISAPLKEMQQNIIPSADINRVHQTDILLGGAYGRYTSESKADSWPNKFSTYDAPDGWSSVMFNEIITKVYPPMMKLQTLTEDPIILSVADILKVMAMHRVTDTYGPIPYSKIGADGAIQVPYDSQRDIYMMMFEELDHAINILTEKQTSELSKNADLLYGGGAALTKWIKLANSLKLRLAMRIVYAEPQIAQTKAEEAVNHTIGVMTSNSDNAQLGKAAFGTEGNPISVAVKYNNGDNRVVADMPVYMNGYKDPRRSAYFNNSPLYEDGKNPELQFIGYRSGIKIGGVDEFKVFSTININQSSPLQLMNVAEVMFLKAEGALRGWNMGGTAEDFYNEGIRMSFEQWGVSGADAYLADDTSIPDTYKDPNGLYSYNTRLTDLTIKWDSGNKKSFEQRLERIIIQKWLANYLLGQEAWADRRRTGYPKLLPVVVNNSPGGILKNSDIPRRCPYPSQEAVNNAANYAAALGLLGGTDNIATRVWWDCKP